MSKCARSHCGDLQRLTRGAVLSYANVAGIIRVYWEITCFKVHIAGRWNGVEAQDLDWYRQYFGVCEELLLDNAGGEARGAGLVEAVGKEGHP